MKYFIALILLFSISTVNAQVDYNAGGGAWAGYFDAIAKLMLAIGAIVGLLAAIKVYNRWHIGEDDLFEGVSNLFLGAIFLILISGTLKIIFGL